MNQNDFCEWLPPEVTSYIFSQLDIQSLCRASMTCMSWFATIRNDDSLWKPHCLAVRAVCEREVDDDRKSGYSWRPCQSASLVSNKQLNRQQPTTSCDDAGLPLSGHTTEELQEESSETWMAKWQLQQHMFSY